jgi:hypothetical protein
MNDTRQVAGTSHDAAVSAGLPRDAVPGKVCYNETMNITGSNHDAAVSAGLSRFAAFGGRMTKSRSTSLHKCLIHDSGCTRSLVDESHPSVMSRRLVENLPCVRGIESGNLKPIGLEDISLGKFVMKDCLLVPSGNSSLISAREVAEKLGYISVISRRLVKRTARLEA